jgi:dihydroneopterin aldolase
MLNKIIIKGLRLYAYHGVMELERKVGAYFTIDCEVETDIQDAIANDFVDDTISYADLYETIKREMAQPSFLVEHAAGRITKAILHEYSNATSARLRLLKENPPMGADCQGAGVDVTMERTTLS